MKPDPLPNPNLVFSRPPLPAATGLGVKISTPGQINMHGSQNRGRRCVNLGFKLEQSLPLRDSQPRTQKKQCERRLYCRMELEAGVTTPMSSSFAAADCHMLVSLPCLAVTTFV